jgi:hypothetical protein
LVRPVLQVTEIRRPQASVELTVRRVAPAAESTSTSALELSRGLAMPVQVQLAPRAVPPVSQAWQP